MVNNRVIVVLLCCSFLFAISSAQVAWQYDYPIIHKGILSDPIVVSTSGTYFDSAVSLTLTVEEGSAVFTPNTLNFGPSSQSASFRVLVSSDILSIHFTSSDANYVAPLNLAPNIRILRSVKVDTIPRNLNVKLPSEPLKITLQYPPSQGPLTFTPSTTADITFQPSSIEIPVGSNSGSFVVTALSAFSTFVSVTWNIAGEEADLYQNGSFASVSVTSNPRRIQAVFPDNVLMGDSSTVLYVWTNDRVNDTVTITPSATDTVFTPSTFDFTPDVSKVAFTINSTSPAASKIPYFYITGPGKDDYYDSQNSFSTPFKTVSVVSPKSLVLNRKSQISLRISAPVVSSLEVLLFAANLAFNPTNVTFTGKTTSVVVDITPFATGVDSISFTLGGDDVAYYTAPTDVTGISITSGTFSTWYKPLFWIGFESDKIPIRVDVAPAHDVNLTLFCPDAIFNPPTITFSAGNVQQYFTITPTFTATDATDDTVFSSNIKFLVGGTDWASYAVPTDVSIFANRRTIQTKWPPHVTADFSGKHQLYLQKQYVVWIVANHVTDPLTITPVNPYMTFDPPVIQLTSSSKHVTFKVTVNAVVGDTRITYLIGGQNGGLYQSINDDVINTAFRPLSISSAVISPDSRVLYGVIVNSPSDADLSSDHVNSFELMSSVVPDGSLTITPHSAHINFIPSSITLSNALLTVVGQTKQINRGYQFTIPNQQVTANFTVTPLASGTHYVWFELSGSDGAYYEVPPHTLFSFWLDERVTSELPRILSSSSRVMVGLVPAFAVLLLLVINVVFM